MCNHMRLHSVGCLFRCEFIIMYLSIGRRSGGGEGNWTRQGRAPGVFYNSETLGLEIAIWVKFDVD